MWEVIFTGVLVLAALAVAIVLGWITVRLAVGERRTR